MLAGVYDRRRVLVAGWTCGPDDRAVLAAREVMDRFKTNPPDLSVQHGKGHAELHEAIALRLGCTKANQELGWHPVWDSKHEIYYAARWQASLRDGSLRTKSDTVAYVADSRTLGQRWSEA